MQYKIVHFLKEPFYFEDRERGRQNREPAFSLLELLMVIAISTLLFTLALPPLAHQARDAHMRSFAAKLSANLGMARRYAQIAGTSVKLDFTETQDYRFQVLVDLGNDQWRPLIQNIAQSGYGERIRNQLPASALPHPTQNKMLTTPLSSNHAPFLIFGPRGSSSGTLVFSDGGNRAVCAVISSQTARIRVYLWRATDQSWQQFF